MGGQEVRLRTRERELGWEGRKLDYGPERERGEGG